MSVDRVMVSLPRKLREEVDEALERNGVRRSSLIQELLGDWLESEKRAELERLMEEGYRARAAEHEEWVTAIAPLQAEVWSSLPGWDDDE